MMKNGLAERPGGEQPGITMPRKEILDDYINYYSHTWSEAHGKVCSDERLITKADQFLLSEDTEPRERFVTLPFYRMVCEGLSEASPARECRRHLEGFIKATQVLERLCVNLFLYPWKKEFKTIKTCTGAFVYNLLPVLSHSSIQSVMALIGYLPDLQHRTSSQYRLSEEADPDRAIALGFELLLARLECQHIVRLTEQAQQGPQDWAEILQRRAGHHGGMESLGLPSETTTTAGQENDQLREEEDMEEYEEDVDSSGKEPDQASQVLRSLEAKPEVKPRPRQGAAAASSTRHLLNDDKSILEMQDKYPDLAIRGRPLRNSIKAANSTKNKGSDSKTANITSDDHTNGVKDASVDDAECNHNESAGGNNSSSSNSNIARGRSVRDTTSNSDKNRAGGVSSESGFSGPAGISMHITLRAHTPAQTSEDKMLEDHKPEPLPRAAARRGDQSSGGLPKSASSNKEQPFTNSTEEEDNAQRMGQVHHQGRKASRRRDRETKNEEKKRRDEEDDVPGLQNARYSVEESVDEEDDSYPGQGGPGEGNQPILCHPPAVVNCNIPDCHSCKEEEGESTSGSKKDSRRRKDKAGEKDMKIDWC